MIVNKYFRVFSFVSLTCKYISKKYVLREVIKTVSKLYLTFFCVGYT
jgi:hypothetical protein